MNATWQRDLRVAAVPIGAVVLVLTLGAVASFPELDDTYLFLMLRESGPAAIVPAHPDRPLAAHLWQLGARALGSGFWPAAFALHAALWFLLGLCAARLMTRLFPERRRYAAVAGSLAVAPLVVQTQLSTVTISLLGLVSVLLGYLAIELGGRYVSRAQGTALVAGCAAIAGGALFSEYAVPVALAGAILLGAGVASAEGRSRWRRAAAALTATALGAFLLYHVAGDSSARHRVDPLRPLLYPERLIDAPLDLATRAWQVVAGAYGTGAGNLRVSWDTKSSLVALAGGCALAAGLAWIVRPPRSGADAALEPPPRSTVIGILALAAGLAPVALMQAYEPTAFASRFHLPVVPVAAALTVSLALAMARPRFRIAAVVLLGLVAGAASVRHAWTGWKRQQTMAAIGAAVRPLIRGADGLTLVVLSGDPACPFDYACTGEATADWTAEEGRAVWFATPRELPFDLAHPAACAGRLALDQGLRSVTRRGRIGQLLWVDVRADAFRLWPYCDSPARREGA